MLPITVDDLLPLEEYAGRRKEFFESHRRYIDRCRRVRIGPSLTLTFENRQTLWYRVQEVVRIARLANRRDVQMELNLYNRLLPGANLLQAALLIEVSEPAALVRELAAWRELRGEHLVLHAGPAACAAQLVTARPQDRCIGTAHWVQFPLSADVRRFLECFDEPADFAFDNGVYRHSSIQLSRELRQSLLDDLDSSARDERKQAG
jgi:hypothetical protein